MATGKNEVFETMIAGADLSAAASRYKTLYFDPSTENECLITTAVTQVCAGILYEGATEGNQVLVAVGGRCLFKGGTTLVQGDKIGVGTDGEAAKITEGTSTTAVVIGVVREGCTDGNIGSALLSLGGQHIAVKSA